MATAYVVVRGILKPDGSLELESTPHLPAGPVEVVLRSLALPPQSSEDWWQYLQRVRAELEAAGTPFRTAEAIDQERQDFRGGEDRIEEMYRQGKRATHSLSTPSTDCHWRSVER
jgi:hypothetical protein